MTSLDRVGGVRARHLCAAGARAAGRCPMQLNLLVLSYVVSAAVAAAVSFVAWRRRRLVGARVLALLMLAISWWLLANVLEAAVPDRWAKIAWSVIAYPGIESAPVLYLLFVAGWTRQDGWLTRRRTALLLVVPVLSVAMAATNEWHHLLWTEVRLVDAWGVTAVYEHGPWFWVQATYAYGLVGVAVAALVVAIQRYPAVYAGRLRLVIAAVLAPVAGSALYLAGLGASVHADLSSIAFAIAGIDDRLGRAPGRAARHGPRLVAGGAQFPPRRGAVLDPGHRIATFDASATRMLGIESEFGGARHRRGALAISGGCRAVPRVDRAGGRRPRSAHSRGTPGRRQIPGPGAVHPMVERYVSPRSSMSGDVTRAGSLPCATSPRPAGWWRRSGRCR